MGLYENNKGTTENKTKINASNNITCTTMATITYQQKYIENKLSRL